MMRNLSLILLLLPFVAAGQNDGKWQLGLQVRPGITGVISYQVNFSSEPKFGFSTFLAARKHVKPNFFIQTGLGFGSYRYNRTQSDLILNWDIDPQQGVISSSKLIENYGVISAELPVFCQFQLPLNLYATAGVQFNFRHTNSINRTIYSTNGQKGEMVIKDVIPLYTASAVVGVGYLINFTDIFCLNLEPLFKWNFTDPIMNYGDLYELSLQIGCFVRL